MVRLMRWHCPTDTGFEIIVVWGRARYFSVTEVPHNSLTFQAGRFNHCTRAPALKRLRCQWGDRQWYQHRRLNISPPSPGRSWMSVKSAALYIFGACNLLMISNYWYRVYIIQPARFITSRDVGSDMPRDKKKKHFHDLVHNANEVMIYLSPVTEL